jgi:hypothetical protein
MRNGRVARQHRPLLFIPHFGRIGAFHHANASANDANAHAIADANAEGRRLVVLVGQKKGVAAGKWNHDTGGILRCAPD